MIQNSFILDFLLSRESNNNEIIENANSDKICQNACAMANQQGGSIVVGVSEDGNIVGLTETEINLVSDALLTHVSPSLPFVTSIINKERKKVLVITVWEGGNKPYSTGGFFYTRNGNEVVHMNQKQIKQVFMERQSLDENWERECVYDASIKRDVDENIIDKFRQALGKDGKISNDAAPNVILAKLGFLRKSTLTNAAVVVSCKQPSSFLPQTRIRISVFGKAGELTDVKLIDCNLVLAIDQMVDYITGFYPKKMSISGLLREETEIMPKVALREGILNSIVHRKYDDFRSFVRINIYSDRLEIINSGDLMNGITIEDFKREHSSFLRNPDIANAFYILRYIEAAGTGTMRIIDECRKNHCPSPVWSVENGCVKLVFFVERPVAGQTKNLVTVKK